MASCGIDATHTATTNLINLAARLLGAPPLFFGRYFKGPHNPSPIQYQPAEENSVLHAQHIPVLCIARQTNRVGGTQTDGVTDAVNNMTAVASAFGIDYLMGLGFNPLIFLDTEPDVSLSVDYYLGWSEALLTQGPGPSGAQLCFSPAIYINQNAPQSWNALADAINRGGQCSGAWVANYGNRTGVEGPPAWDDGQVSPVGLGKAPCPILGWQYAGDYEDVLDFSILNEQSAQNTIGMMVLPP
jgi:hypothetical protein